MTRARFVDISGIAVRDASQRDIVQEMARGLPLQTVAYALHIGGLNARKNLAFTEAMNRADLVYADGKSVEWLGKIGGAKNIERAATTDIGLIVVQSLEAILNRKVRIALVGGPDTLAEEAGAVFEQTGIADSVYTHPGYEIIDSLVCERITASRPDLVLVGLGMPYVAMWVDRNRQELPDCLIMTVGGWFGFLTGREQRAPIIMQRAGLEWVYRMANSRGRLVRRYVTGMRTFAVLALSQVTESRDG